AVAPGWPSIGKAEFDPPLAANAAFREQGGAFGAAVDDAFFARLKLKVGDTFALGNARLVVRARIKSEPDTLASGLAFGARALISLDALRATGLIEPGALIRWTTRVNLSDGEPPSEAAVDAFIAEAKAKFPEAGWEVRARANVSPEFERNLGRFGEFLALAGLMSLVVGGVGVANAAVSFVDRKQGSLAIFKSLGATGGEVVALALIEFLAVAALAVVIGLALGAATPYLVAAIAGAALPYPIAPAIYPRELALGALYGLITAFAFSLAPLGRAHDLTVSALFRDLVAGDAPRPRRRYALFALIGAAALAALAILASPQKTVAVTVVVATVVALAALRLVASLAMVCARAAPRPRWVEARLALANLHRPGAPTPSVVISLGLGLAVIVALTLVDVNLRGQLRPDHAGAAPNFYFLDIRNTELEAFRQFLAREAPGAKIVEAPMMRGRIVRIGNVPAAEAHAKEDAQWALEGDRGVSFADTPPEGSALITGDWWPKDYSGPPLVSLESGVADGLGLKIGDSIAVNVLGRDVTAKIANLRKVDWRSFGINFVLVFSPDTFRGAPYSVLMTAALPGKAAAAEEIAIVDAAARRFPTVSTVRVSEALDAVQALVAKLAEAVRAASGVALATSVLTLAGALAANRSARIADAVVLEVLGATRGRLMAMFLIEYAALGAATAVFGVGAGTLAAYVVVAKIMRFDFVFDAPAASSAALVGLALTVALGMIGAWRILGIKPAEALRSPR
ncbi:MAG: ABC transporter permease, partial [Roseiarcus sp.]